jgi:hypothetical protein
MLKVDTRQAFEALRDHPHDRLNELDDSTRLIRQFLRGDAEGPITERRAQTNYADDLLGVEAPRLTKAPGIEPSRVVK